MGTATVRDTEMKLTPLTVALSIQNSAAGFEWVQPTYREVLKGIRTRDEVDWGHPVNRNGALPSLPWQDCPTIAPGENVDEIKCNRSTCLLKCSPGFIKVGKGRTRCRFSNELGSHWGNELGKCQGCPPENPSSPDTKLDIACTTSKAGKRQCKLTCPVGNKVSGFPVRKFKILCKCPKNKGCGWFKRKREINASSLSCLAPPTTAPKTTTTKTTTTTTTVIADR